MDFDDYYAYHGIHREKTVPGTPQENGVSERMNRTIMERVRSMRLHVGLPLGPSISLDGGILEEAWKGKIFIFEDFQL